ncbi:hypothetical protein CPB86DRAFT_351190 [Serendipita vermifera]|nr:hypothetical protein CPB86DRAFT_351190 [Serendipita vermifera]
MPYLSPSSSQTTTTTTTETESSRPSHRRTRSETPTFSTETGPGAFTPLVGIPRRQRQFEKRPLFQIAPDDDEEQEGAVTAPKTQPQPSRPKDDKPSEPQIKLSVPSTPPAISDIPFPTKSGTPVESSLPFPSFDPPANSPARSSTISRSGSTPIVLANGKPLKPSLKSSMSSPQIADWRAQHPRSRSEPSTPLVPKTVHFPEQKDNLESVVVFEKTARPRAVSGHADDTETETEGYDSPANGAILAGGRDGFPFPAEQPFGLDIDSENSSPVPCLEPSAFSNVHLETMVFPRTRPPTLRGSILVKNVAFEKHVALRFTLDNWQTTSEVVCKHVCTLPTLPSPFPPERPAPGAALLSWDRFSFLVRLEDVERKLAERTIFVAARYQAAGVGEWWDNNGGKNYKVVFKKATTTSSTPSAARVPSPLRFSDAPKKMYPGLDLRQTTLISSSDPSIPPLKLKKPTFSTPGTSTPPKAPPSAPSATTVNAVVAPPPPFATASSNTTSAHQRNPSNSSLASSSSSGSLRLSNYASPASPVALGRNHSRGSSMMWQDGELGPIVGGQPITSPPIPPALQLPDQDSGTTPKKRSPTNSIASTASPASTGIPITPASPGSNDRTPPANGFANDKNTSFPFTSNDSRYAALVEQWCFHQSPPPGMGSNPSADLPAPGLGPAAGTSPNISSGYGSGYGYGHQYSMGKPLTLKP